eukprot:g1780.t1
MLVGTTQYTVQFSPSDSPNKVAREVCTSLVTPDDFENCTIAVRSEVLLVSENHYFRRLSTRIDKACPDGFDDRERSYERDVLLSTPTSGSNTRKDRPNVRLTIENRNFLVRKHSVGRAQYYALQKCGVWRPGLTLLAKAVLETAGDSDPMWIEVSSRTSAIDAGVFENDDVSYFSLFAAAQGADVHIFDPRPARILEIMNSERLNPLEGHLTGHFAYLTGKDRGSPGFEPMKKTCADPRACVATLSGATKTTLDRALFSHLYRHHGKKRVTWLHIRPTSARGAHELLYGARKLFALGWINTVLIDTRQVAPSNIKPRTRLFDDTFNGGEYAFACLDKTACDVDVSSMERVRNRLDTLHIQKKASTECRLLVAFRNVGIANSVREWIESRSFTARAREARATGTGRATLLTKEAIERAESASKRSFAKWFDGTGSLWFEPAGHDATFDILSGNLNPLHLSSLLRVDSAGVSSSSSSKYPLDEISDEIEECAAAGQHKTIDSRGKIAMKNEDCQSAPGGARYYSTEHVLRAWQIATTLSQRNAVFRNDFEHMPVMAILKPILDPTIVPKSSVWTNWAFAMVMHHPVERALRHVEVANFALTTKWNTTSSSLSSKQTSLLCTHCGQNYYTRLLAGKSSDDRVTRSDLEVAKLMLQRTSCLLLRATASSAFEKDDHQVHAGGCTTLSAIVDESRDQLDRMVSSTNVSTSLRSVFRDGEGSLDELIAATSNLRYVQSRWDDVSSEDLKDVEKSNDFDLRLWDFAIDLLRGRQSKS